MDVSQLHRMAEQIALNFAVLGNETAVAATADHIQKFWDPRMKEAVFEHDRSGLSPIVSAAFNVLEQGKSDGGKRC